MQPKCRHIQASRDESCVTRLIYAFRYLEVHVSPAVRMWINIRFKSRRIFGICVLSPVLHFPRGVIARYTQLICTRLYVHICTDTNTHTHTHTETTHSHPDPSDLY